MPHDTPHLPDYTSCMP